MRILIVEDEAIVAMHIESMLKKNKFEVVGICGCASSAVQLYQNEKPDLVLMDIMLSGDLTGIDAVKLIAKNNNPKIIYMTGNSDNYTKNIALETNPSDFILKPISERNLLDVLSKL